MSKQFTIQLKVSAIIDIPYYGKSVENAVEKGRVIKWKG